MKIVFATSPTREGNEVLNAVGAEDRLLSYWYLKSLPPGFLAEYVKNGIGPNRKEKDSQSVEDGNTDPAR